MPKKLSEVSERFLADVPDDKVFWVHDGGSLKNLRELGEALNAMPDEIFGYHSNLDKKDFSNWVRDVITDEKLARDLEKSKTRLQAARTVERRLANLTKQVA